MNTTNSSDSSMAAAPYPNPWLSFWGDPRTTILRVLESYRLSQILWVYAAMMFFLGLCLPFVVIQLFPEILLISRQNLLSDWPIILCFGLACGAALGVLCVPVACLFAWVLKLTSRWLGGVANTREILGAGVWMFLIYMTVWILLALSFVMVVRFGGTMYQMVYGFKLVLRLFASWIGWLMWAAFSEIMQISIWRVVGASLLQCIILCLMGWGVYGALAFLLQ